MLKFNLLGKPEVILDGQRLTGFETAKVQALLFYLVVTGRPQARTVLAELLWGDMTESMARRNLTKALSTLRHFLAAYLIIEQDSIAFNQNQPYHLDVAVFRAAVEAGEALPANENLETSLAPLRQAVNLYQGDFLEGFQVKDALSFEEWLLAEREQLRQLMLDALLRLVKAYAAENDFEPSLHYTRQLLAIAPWQEAAHQQLMILLARTGQRTAALAQYEICRQVLAEELGVEPSAETTALYERLKAAGAPRPHNLPLTDGFVGRTAELAQITTRLNDPRCRLLTLTGPGGIGKTRLALKAAEQFLLPDIAGEAADFADGVYFIDLGAAESELEKISLAQIANRLGSAIAGALKFSFQGSTELLTQVSNYLAPKKVLLVLDNFEQLVEGAVLLGDLLKRAPHLKLLITSRERLNLQDEWVLDIEGLTYPLNYELLATNYQDYSAVALFMQRAQRVRTNFTLTDSNAPFIGRLCQLVEGAPLALELAAGWLKVLSCQEIVAEIERGLDFLQSLHRDVPPRHRSLRVVFEESWRMLSEPEQTVLRQLAVFRGGFFREAAQTVAGATLPVLTGLIEKSLLRLSTADRYHLHELLRQYATEKLETSGRAGETRAAHSDYYLRLLYRQETNLTGSGQLEALNLIETELENIRAAWNRAIEQEQAAAIEQSLNSLFYFYSIRSRFQEGQEAFGRAAGRLQAGLPLVDLPAPVSPVVTKLLIRQGSFYHALGRYELGRNLLEAGLDLAQQIGLQREVALALRLLGDIGMARGDYVEAKRQYRASLAAGQAGHDQANMAAALFGLGWVTRFGLPDFSESKRLLQESLALYRAIDHQANIARLLDKLGAITFILGQYDEAHTYYRESLALFKQLDDRLGIALALGGLGLVGLGRGKDHLVEAKRFCEESLVICQETGHQLEIAYRYYLLGQVNNNLGAVEAAETYYQQARAITTEIGVPEVLAFVLVGLGEVAAGRGDLPLMRQYLLEALASGLNQREYSVALKALVSWANLLSRDETGGVTQPATGKSRPEQATGLLSLVINHPAAWQMFKDEASALLSILEPQLTPQALAAARQWGAATSVEEAVAEILQREQPASLQTLSPTSRFVQETLLATGGMGEIYRGRDMVTGQPVAIKRLRREYIEADPGVIQRLLREAAILGQLNHPNIVKILDTLEIDGQPAIVMELVPGGSLRSLLDKQPQLPLTQVLSLGLELADALARVHHLGVLHRDLKPANILLAADGSPRLTDFGVAYLARQETRLTREGTILGTSAYLSPEAWRGETLDARSDIWSFGAVLYEMLAGKPPFAANQVTVVLTAILNDPVPDLFQFRPDAPPALVELIKQMLIKEREQRIDSMRQVAAGLEVVRRSLI